MQPEAYARAVFTRQLPPFTDEQIDRKVAARLERQTLLTERPNTAFTFIIEQAVLERRVGGAAVTRTVIDHLLNVGRRTNVEIQIMPPAPRRPLWCRRSALHGRNTGTPVVRVHRRTPVEQPDRRSQRGERPPSALWQAAFTGPGLPGYGEPLKTDARSAMSTTPGLSWFKSSYSGGDGGDNCVEVALRPEAVHVRDSKDTSIRPLVVTPSTWATFTALAAASSLDD